MRSAFNPPLCWESRTQNFSQLITSSSGSKPEMGELRQRRLAVLGRGGDEQLSEGPRVDEAKLAALGEGDHRVGVGGLRLLQALHPLQLAAHPEMDDERRAVVEGEQQVLAGTVDRLDRVALEQGAELLGARVASHRAPVSDLDRLDLPADDFALEVTPDGLDFGKLRHSPCLSPPRATHRPPGPRPVRASFLDLPSPAAEPLTGNVHRGQVPTGVVGAVSLDLVAGDATSETDRLLLEPALVVGLPRLADSRRDPPAEQGEDHPLRPLRGRRRDTTAPITASVASARIDSFVRPPDWSSPRPEPQMGGDAELEGDLRRAPSC